MAYVITRNHGSTNFSGDSLEANQGWVQDLNRYRKISFNLTSGAAYERLELYQTTNSDDSPMDDSSAEQGITQFSTTAGSGEAAVLWEIYTDNGALLFSNR